MTSANTAPDELTQLRELVARLQKENSLLRQKIDALARRLFGSSSEQLDPKQLELVLQMASAPAEPPAAPAPAAAPVEAKTRQPKPARAPRIPENLPLVEEVIEPAEVAQSPQDWRCIGQEVSEQLDYEPARFLRRRIVRKPVCSLTFW